MSRGSATCFELREGLLVALDRAVPSDFVSINEIGPNPADLQSVIRPPVPEHLHDVWATHGHENPLVERFGRTLDTRAYRFSDVVSSAELHSLPLYREFYAELGVEHQIAFVIDVSPPFYVAIALSRSEHNFTDGERALLDRARPCLIQIYRTAIAQTTLQAQSSSPGAPRHAARAAGATADSRLREAAVLGRVARGQSNKLIAAELTVSERTIGKHLQRCYRKLGVANRAHAAAIVWQNATP